MSPNKNKNKKKNRMTSNMGSVSDPKLVFAAKVEAVVSLITFYDDIIDFLTF